MKLVVNGADHEVDDRHAKTPLLWVLRDILGMHGTKFGCGAGFCAACTVLVDGKNAKSCQTATEHAVGKAVTTFEGAAGPVVDAVRDAWYHGNVVQCGYCQPGQTLAAVSLLESNPTPDDAEIDNFMSGNLCRCGTYPRIRAAIHAAADTLASGVEPGPLIALPVPENRRLTAEEMADPVHPYVRILQDGTIVAYSSQIEMGQGIHTGLATLVAEELDADFDMVRVVNAANGRGPTGADVYGNPDLGSAFQLTGASNSMKGIWPRYRLAAAQARARLAAAAAEEWGVPIGEVELHGGVVRHRDGHSASFGALAARAEQLPVPEGVRLKDPAEYKLIGREGRLRVDAPPKILGQTTYTIDVTLPGMLTALVLHPPKFGARAASIDDAAALAERGVVAVVPISEGVAVVAETLADARRGFQALSVEWDDADAERRSSVELLAEHVRLAESGEGAIVARDDGDVERALANADVAVDAVYTVPYLAHAAMEPNNSACRMRDDGVLEVWVGSESPEYVMMNASSIAEIDKERVEVHVTFAGGSFGLHSSFERDPTSEAVEIARALKWRYPIKVQSLREEEFKVGRFRAMAAHRVRVGADAAGHLTAWHQRIVAAPTSVNLPFVRDVMFTNGVDFFTTTGAVDPPYAVENFRLEATNFETPVSTMVWRSVGNSHTEFARECAIDELAVATGRDPVEFRLELLADSPRTLRALELAALRADWGAAAPAGTGRGLAGSGFVGHSATIIDVSLDARGRVRVDRVLFTLDCGRIVNPDLIRAQVEGGILWGLSAASWGEIVIGDGGEIVTQNFDRYPIMRMRSVPQIDVHLIESSEPPTGVGEASVPSVAPALANAIAALTGTRIRQLPFTNTIKIA